MEWTPVQIVQHFQAKLRQLSSVQQQIDDLEEKLEALAVEAEAEEMERLCEELSNLQDLLPQEEEEEHLIHQSLLDFGLKEHHFKQRCCDLSLGQQKAILLAVASLGAPLVNLLLMDEPTNHLDVQQLIQLRRLLLKQQDHGTVVLVSHDVDLINDMASNVVEFHDRKLCDYPGNYNSYRLLKEQQEKHDIRQSLIAEKKREQLKSTLQHLKGQPVSKRKGGAKKKAKAIASHQKKMDRHEAASGPLVVRGLTAQQRQKLAEIRKNVPDKAVQFVYVPFIPR